MPRKPFKPAPAATCASGSKSNASDAGELLAAGVAHDVNNLLTIIAGQRELLRRAGGRAFTKDREVTRKASEQAQRLTRRLLALGRKRVMKQATLNLNTEIEKMREMLDGLVGENIELELKLDPKPGLIRADPARLGQAILNLAINAREAMAQGGRLTLGTSNATLEENSRSRPEQIAPGRYASLSVKDTGSGMDRATLRRIFEPFFSTKPQGSGLGLATVSAIVRQSTGYIRVSSKPGQGTAFQIYFPLIGKGMKRGAPSPTDGAVRRRPKTVLLVEDDPAVRHVARQFLEIGGCSVVEAKSGAGAIRMVSSRASSIDLLITDIAMPRMNGPELAQRLTQLRPGLKVLYVSGFSGASLGRQSLPEGAHLLEKPYALESMMRKVQEVLDRTGRRRPGKNSPIPRRAGRKPNARARSNASSQRRSPR